MNNSEPRWQARSRDSTGKKLLQTAGTALRGRNGCGKFLKEIIGNLLGGTIDQALAKLGKLATDLGLDVIRQQRAAVLFGERDCSRWAGQGR